MRKSDSSPYSPFTGKHATKQLDEKKMKAEDEFIQKVLDVQTEQMEKAQYYLQVTYCFETDFCHRFVNFEIPEGLISQFEN